MTAAIIETQLWTSKKNNKKAARGSSVLGLREEGAFLENSLGNAIGPVSRKGGTGKAAKQGVRPTVSI